MDPDVCLEVHALVTEVCHCYPVLLVLENLSGQSRWFNVKPSVSTAYRFLTRQFLVAMHLAVRVRHCGSGQKTLWAHWPQ
jgi:hypothetical protein